jgi:YggT family protein
LRPGFRPKGLFLPVSEIIFTVTDPPLKFLRRFIKPVRFGAISLDFAWTLLVLGVILLRNLVLSLV